MNTEIVQKREVIIKDSKNVPIYFLRFSTYLPCSSTPSILDETVEILSLKEGVIETKSDTELILAFADPSTLTEYPGWPLRNLLALIAKKCPEKLKRGLKVLCLRQKAVIGGQLDINSSKILNLIWENTDENQGTIIVEFLFLIAHQKR